MKEESKLWQKVKKNTPNISWTRIESWASFGFPDLVGYDEIAIDLETRDPGIKDKGPGYIRKDGEVVGIAVAVEGWCGYYPIAHDTPPNMDKNIVTKA